MTKKSTIERNLKRSKLFILYRQKRLKLITVRNNRFKPLEHRFEAQLLLSDLPKNSSKTRIVNRCFLTGRSRGVYKKFSLSRICFRSLACSRQLPGILKSSWS